VSHSTVTDWHKCEA